MADNSPLKFPTKKFLWGLVIVMLVVVAVVVAYVIRNKQNIPISTPADKPKTSLTAKEDLEQTITQTFTDPKDQDIIKYISFASEDITLDTKYIDYSKAYQLIYQRYATPSATIPVKKALIKLRAYLRAYPQFKEADFKLPK